MGTGGTLAVWSPAKSEASRSFAQSARDFGCGLKRTQKRLNLSDAWRVVSPAAEGSGQFLLRTAVGRLASQLMAGRETKNELRTPGPGNENRLGYKAC